MQITIFTNLQVFPSSVFTCLITRPAGHVSRALDGIALSNTWVNPPCFLHIPGTLLPQSWHPVEEYFTINHVNTN
jgi:hypothetical protein